MPGTITAMDRLDRILVTAIAVVLATCIVVVLAGCGTPNKLTEGKVIGKGYDDPDDWYVSGYTIQGTTTCTGGYNNTPRTCSTSPDIVIPGHWEHDGPHWYLKIQGIRDDGEEKAPEETHEVTELQFNSCDQGEHWTKDQPCPT